MPTYRVCLTDQVASFRLGISLLLLLALMLGGCATLPTPPLSLPVYALPPTSDGDLRAVTHQFADLHSADRSGLLFLNHNDDAFNWRLALIDQAALPPVESKFISLHVKALVGDRQRCFAGSLNLDPRAIDINTENGLYIQSRELCGDMATEFDRLMSADNAWRVDWMRKIDFSGNPASRALPANRPGGWAANL